MSVLLLGISMSAAAVADGSLDVRTTVHKEEVTVDETGETVRKMVPAELVVPGESVYYTITFRNVGEENADNVVITNPIAENLTYVDGSAFGPGTDIQFSADGGATFAAASDLTVAENGRQRPATAEDYTHVRWVMQNNLEPGAQGTARFAAVLD
ncbi:MAG: hypothetical protein QNJ07_12975 [Woeseiaceae bacterium]|nr:hypothetical protein [Woeseiaceae bacterium]